MTSHHSRCAVRAPLLAGTLLAAALSALPASAHPLDALTEAEISEAVALLADGDHTGAGTLYPYISLKEPEKSVVLAWQEGNPEPRTVEGHFKNDTGAFVAEVDLAGDRVVSVEPAGGETMILLAEFMTARELATGDPAFVAGR